MDTIYIFPQDPNHLPSAEKRNMALEYFRKICPLPNANMSYYFYDTPTLLGQTLVNFAVGASNPSTSSHWVGRDLKKETVQKMEKIIGCKIAVLWAKQSEQPIVPE